MSQNDRLRQQRILRNWRQQDVADQLGVAPITVMRWESGSHQPSAYYRIKLCKLFGTSAQDLGLVEAPAPLLSHKSETQQAEPLSPSLSDQVALWTVPYARNPHFTGRDDLLDLLAQRLSPREVGQPTTIRRAALTQSQIIKGLGGVGKTQIAVEYAYRAREQELYTHTIWIHAASEEAILTSFGTLADFLPSVRSKGKVDQRKLVAAVIHWLELCEQPWLLIFDNADTISLIQSYLPRQGNGSILLTTRAHAGGSLASSIEVDTMSVLEGTQLLLRRAQLLDNASDDEINEAGNLVMELGQFPLALDQAGAYLEETGCRVGDYLQIYQRHRHALLARRGIQATQYPDSVATTWSLSFQHIEQANPAAAELLCLCAFLAPDHIPEELLIEGAPYWPPALQEAVTDPFTFNQLLETLLAFSLVKRLSKDRLLSIHRLVQVVQVERLSLDVQIQWAHRLVRAVHLIYPSDPRDDVVSSWPRCHRYLEQAQACDLLIQQYHLLLPEAAEVLNRAGAYLRERALYSLATSLFQRALSIGEQQGEAGRISVADALSHLGTLFYRLGKYTEAEPLFLRAVSLYEQDREPVQLQMAYALDGLANIYSDQGKYIDAEPLHQQALRMRELHVGPEHRQVAYSLNNLALLAFRQGKYSEAEPLYLRTLHIYKLQEGTLQPQIAFPLRNLAFLYTQQKKYMEAENFYQQALTICKQYVGSEHPQVALMLGDIAWLYQEQKKYAQAELLYQQALNIWEQQGASEHPEATYSLIGLAHLSFQQGKEREAEDFYQKALRIRTQQLGAEHPETAQVLHDFANFQQTRGKHQEAACLYQRALTIREKVFGADHPVAAESRERLQEMQVALGQTEGTTEQEVKQ